MITLPENKIPKSSTFSSKSRQLQSDLLTPYFQRTLQNIQNVESVKNETAIEEWLSDRSIRLVTLETIQYERKTQLTCLTDISNTDMKLRRFASTSLPINQDSLLYLNDNSLFMRRKISKQ